MEPDNGVIARGYGETGVGWWGGIGERCSRNLNTRPVDIDDSTNINRMVHTFARDGVKILGNKSYQFNTVVVQISSIVHT